VSTIQGPPSADCGTDRRRARVRADALAGIDSVEASDDGRTLTVVFLGKAPDGLTPANVTINGGRRITGIAVTGIELDRPDDPELDDSMVVTVDRAGDSSAYALCVVETGPYGRPGNQPHHGFDPRYACASFTFQAACPSDHDCAARVTCPPVPAPAVVIDYTAKDYDSFTRLLLDRMALTVPDWAERHVPDLGLTLVEVLAYVADQLSYQQDAVAAEAYLDTARRRVSLRRHARLVDYAMHDGCNARAFITLMVAEDLTLRAGTYRFAAIDASAVAPQDQPQLGVVLLDDQLQQLPAEVGCEVFEPLIPGDIQLRQVHNEIGFWTWGNEDCCLPAGATSATLRDAWVPGHAGPDRPTMLKLREGDILVVEEVLGPRTGAPADADPGHRQAVRLVSVTKAVDDLYDQPVAEVTWADEDALTFQVCLSTHGGPQCQLLTDVSVARGNVLVADHGRSITFCGYGPETFPVPPAQVTVPSCGAPAFGCPDRPDESPALRFIHALLDRSRGGQGLTTGDIAQLGALVGAAAVTRADLAASAAASGQAAALEALLAQLTYPPVATRFRPLLSYAPVTQCTPYPAPELVSAAQAARLAGLPDQARARVTELQRIAADGRALTGVQLAELVTLFGQPTLDQFRLAARPAAALNEMLDRFDELLQAKLARAATLTAWAAAGLVLPAGAVWEIRSTWGDRYAEDLAPDDPALAGPAARVLIQDPRSALPAATAGGYTMISPGDPAVGEQLAGSWRPRRDLLAAGPRDLWFAGEVEDSGRLALRFGDGRQGMAPPAGGELRVSYRVGNGTAGNVGAEAISHLVLCDSVQEGVQLVRNPLAAAGGVDAESLADVRALAPLAPHRSRLRAITADDYAALATQVAGVARAAAQIRWTGSAEEVHVVIEPTGGEVPGDALISAVAHALEPFRRICHGLVVGPVTLVPLDIRLSICVDAGYQRAHVADAVLAALGTGTAPGGAPAFFNPAVTGFGDPVRVSRLVAAATAIPGVVSAQVTRLQRLFGTDQGELAAGLLRIGPLEVAQCDNNIDEPDNGRLSVVAGGGR
jgi:Baseplate J-like protein